MFLSQPTKIQSYLIAWGLTAKSQSVTLLAEPEKRMIAKDDQTKYISSCYSSDLSKISAYPTEHFPRIFRATKFPEDCLMIVREILIHIRES